MPNIEPEINWPKFIDTKDDHTLLEMDVYGSKSKFDKNVFNVAMLHSMREGETRLKTPTPPFPWMFQAQSYGSKFRGIGTNNKETAIAYTLVGIAVELFNESKKDYKSISDVRKLLDTIDMKWRNHPAQDPPAIVLDIGGICVILERLQRYKTRSKPEHRDLKFQELKDLVDELCFIGVHINEVDSAVETNAAFKKWITGVKMWHQLETAYIMAMMTHHMYQSEDVKKNESTEAKMCLEIKELLEFCGKLNHMAYMSSSTALKISIHLHTKNQKPDILRRIKSGELFNSFEFKAQTIGKKKEEEEGGEETPVELYTRILPNFREYNL